MCPGSVPGVSKRRARHSRDTFGHSGARGGKGPGDTLRDTPGDTPVVWGPLRRRRTNVPQLTCNIDVCRSFYYLFFSFVIIVLKPLVLKGKVLGGKFRKCVKKKSVKISETILSFSCCPLVFL